MSRKLFAVCVALLSVSLMGGQAESDTCANIAAGSYDVIYVCPPQMGPDALSLANYRLAHDGYSGIVVETDDIAPCYGTGRLAIRAMISHALQSWSRPPQFVVLIGAYSDVDSSHDLIPTYRISDRTIGQPGPFGTDWVPTDDPYVFGSGAQASIPIAVVARIPVTDFFELRLYIDKLKAYDLDPTATWKRRALHVIEDRDLDRNSGYLAALHADSLRNATAVRFAFNYSHRVLRAARRVTRDVLERDFISAMNEGQGIVIATGTAGNTDRLGYVHVYTACGGPKAGSDSLLGNNRTPIILTTSCGGASSSTTSMYCGTLAQRMLATYPILLAPDTYKGAICYVGVSRAIRESAGYAIAKTWLEGSFGNSNPAPTSRIGPPTLAAKQRLLLSMPNYRNEILSFMILGDPLVQFPVAYFPTTAVSTSSELIRFKVRATQRPSKVCMITVDNAQPGEYRAVLYDVAGRRLETVQEAVASRRPSFRLSFRTNRPGVYFASVAAHGYVATTRLVVVQ